MIIMKFKTQLGQPRISWHQSRALDAVLQRHVVFKSCSIGRSCCLVPRKQLPWELCNIIRRVPSHSPLVMRPVGVRKKTTKYLEFKFAQSLSVIKELTETPVSLEDVPGIMPITKIQPKKTKAKRITQAHGSLTAKELLKKVKKQTKKMKKNKRGRRMPIRRKKSLKKRFRSAKQHANVMDHVQSKD